MHFNEFEYKRIELEEFKAEFAEALAFFQNAQSFQETDVQMMKIYELRNKMESSASLVNLKFSMNTEDAFFATENDYMNEIEPIVEGLVNDFYKALVSSPFRSQLEAKWGNHLFNLADVKLKSFAPEIIEERQLENRLVTQYDKLISTAKVFFDGKERTLAQMGPYAESTDRSIRKAASDAINAFFETKEAELDQIYDQLVKVRHQMALKLGYENYVALGYAQLMRTDYDAKDVAVFRNQVAEHIVPLKVQMKEALKERLGLDHLYHYDESLMFLSGNPKPAGSEDWMMERAREMYHELSPETDTFFTMMADSGLLDLTNRNGKRSGGFCTYIHQYGAPFIFANFNGTTHDVVVLTHEAGHAFQVYLSRDYAVSEYQWPTLEACEIHSMSMEYLTYPWMERFFEKDTAKFVYDHSSKPIEFIPYGVTVDEFQHFVYENPEATPDERKAAWARIEKKYNPMRDTTQNAFLNKGTLWYRQGHIYRRPFYYIDYTLALLCAVQFYVKAEENREKAWTDYVNLCKAGGSKPFTELVKIADLKNPFEEGTVASVIYKVKDLLDSLEVQSL